MPRSATIVPHLSVDELGDCYRHAHEPVARSHWQMVWLVAQGHRIPDVATLVGYTANWVREIVRRYNADGPAGLADRRQHNRGQPPLLDAPAREALAGALAGPAPDGGIWTSTKAAAWMADRLGHPVSPQRGWEALRALGFTLQRPRPRAAKADPAAQTTFKKGGSRPKSTPSGPRTPPPN